MQRHIFGCGVKVTVQTGPPNEENAESHWRTSLILGGLSLAVTIWHRVNLSLVGKTSQYRHNRAWEMEATRANRAESGPQVVDIRLNVERVYAGDLDDDGT